MNPFEKIFNYQIISRLGNSGTFMVTSHERSWLRTMLEHPAAAQAFTAETLTALQHMVRNDPPMDFSDHLMEKARSREKQVYHPLLRSLRRLITNKSGIRITYEIRGGRVNTGHSGFPYKLEYSMVKREWYLLWYHLRHRAFMATRLGHIFAVSAEPIEFAESDRIIEEIGRIIDLRKTETLIEISREYSKELSRILYAFSCFEKNVEFDAMNDTYRVRLRYQGDEAEYLLSKIRFLGKRIRIIEGDYLKRRMLEASTKALARYGIAESEGEELSS